MRVFVTGGAGYIGTHTLLQLLRKDHEVMVFDNYSNSTPEALARVKRLANRDFAAVQGDIRDASAMDKAFHDFRPDAVIHFAGLKAVGESVEKPIDYYAQNLGGTLVLLDAMQRYGCVRIVFSSSATVYGEPQYLPYDEAHPLAPTSPYARTKRMIEDVIRDWALAWPQASAVLLRYFNPVGADVSGQIGEDPQGFPNNLMPFIAQVAVGRRPYLSVHGQDYPTQDGTGERDYVHVEDLARAHLAALEFAAGRCGCDAVNIGTGVAVSVLQMVAAFEKASGRAIPYQIGPRREGDIAKMLACAKKAEQLLNWRADHGLDAMCASVWHWQSQNPQGYKV